MPSPSSVLAPPRHNASGDLAATPAAYEGTVSRVTGSDVFVVLPAFSRTREFGPCVLPTGGTIPSVGDAVWVVFSDEREPVVIAGVAFPSGGGGGASDASTTVKGVTKLSVAPAVASNPIAAGTNDGRLSDQRVPTDGSVTAAKVNGSLKPSGTAATGDEALRALGSGATQAAAGDDSRFPTTGQKNALAGTAGTPGATNQYVTTQDARLSDARTPTAHGHPIAEVTNLQAALDGKVDEALLDAKGDLIVASAADTPARIGVGGDGQVLTADAAQASGVKWATPSGGAADVKQATIDFGSAPRHEGEFTVVDAAISAASQITGSVAFEASTGKDADEATMDPLSLQFQPGSGQFTVHVAALHGRVYGTFKINYVAG